MARFDFYEILINHPTWEENYHDITDPDIRREIMCDVEQISAVRSLLPQCNKLAVRSSG